MTGSYRVYTWNLNRSAPVYAPSRTSISDTEMILSRKKPESNPATFHFSCFGIQLTYL